MFGNRLKELRQQHKMTQQELAKILNVSTSAISHYENESREPSEHIIVTVAKYFNVTCDYLLGMDMTSQFINSENTEYPNSLYAVAEMLNKIIDILDKHRKD